MRNVQHSLTMISDPKLLVSGDSGRVPRDLPPLPVRGSMNQGSTGTFDQVNVGGGCVGLGSGRPSQAFPNQCQAASSAHLSSGCRVAPSGLRASTGPPVGQGYRPHEGLNALQGFSAPLGFMGPWDSLGFRSGHGSPDLIGIGTNHPAPLQFSPTVAIGEQTNPVGCRSSRLRRMY